MRHVRLFAHAFVTAVALVSWGAVVAGIYTQPDTHNMMRLLWFAVLGLACVSSGVAVLPVVVASYIERSAALSDLTGVCQAFYQWGRADERRAWEKGERARPAWLHVVND